MTFIIGTGICMEPLPPVAVQRQPDSSAAALATAIRHGQHGVGAQAALVLGAVQVDQVSVQEGLLIVQAHDGFRDLGVDVFAGLQHALAG
jgi:hypothetical protein